jgi:hypothetical protein
MAERRHPDGTGADEAHLMTPGVLRQLRQRFGAGGERREVWYAPGPADQRTDEHRYPDPQADQVANGEQCEGQQEIEAGHAAAAPITADAKISHHVAAEDTRGHDAGKCRRNYRPPNHGCQAGAALLDRRGIGVFAATYFQHLGAGDAFRVGQIGLRHQRAPQRDRIHHAQDSAQGADRAGNPVRKAGPPADYHHAGQNEDDGGQRAGRRSDGLDDVVFLDSHALETA